MAERLKRAAAWLGLVTDDRYAEYEVDDAERTEGISREELIGAQERERVAAAGGQGGSVTTLQSKRPATTTIAPVPAAAVATQAASVPAQAPTAAPR